MIEKDNFSYFQMFRKLMSYRERNQKELLPLKGCVELRSMICMFIQTALELLQNHFHSYILQTDIGSFLTGSTFLATWAAIYRYYTEMNIFPLGMNPFK